MPEKAEAMHILLSRTRSFIKEYEAAMILRNGKGNGEKEPVIWHPSIQGYKFQTSFDRVFKQLVTVQNDNSKLCGKTIP